MKSPNLLRSFQRLVAPPILGLVLAMLCGSVWAASAHPLPLWRVTDGHGHVLYLSGSMHALTSKDYPLPATFANTFGQSRRLVEELNLNAISPKQVREAIQSFARLPAGKTLPEVMGADWTRAQKLAKSDGISLTLYQRYKPWFAAVRITTRHFVAAGYQPGLGLDRHFANLAAERNMPVTGLETLDEQMGFLDDIEPALNAAFYCKRWRKRRG